jgi:hypothetical protein
MPDGGTGINVGDAVFTFLANTTQLDGGMTRVEAIPGRLAGVRTAVQGLGVDVNNLGVEFDATGENVENAGETIVDTNKRVAGSFKEARGEAMLLAEATGIRLPRHVTSFLASLGPMQGILSAAFSATAVLFLVEALVKGTEKLTDWISNTYIFTDAMRASDQAIKDSNAEIAKYTAEAEKSAKALQRFGDSARELKRLEIGDKLIGDLKDIDTWLGAENKKLEEQPKWWEKTLTAAMRFADWTMGSTETIDFEKQKADTREETRKNNAADAERARNLAKKAASDDVKLQDEKNAQEDADAVYKYQLAGYEKWLKLTQDKTDRERKEFIKQEADAKALAAAMASDLLSVPEVITSFMPSLDNVNRALKDGAKAASNMGITLKTDLAANLTFAKKELDAFTASGIKDDIALAEFKKRVEEADKALKGYGTTAKTTGFELGVIQELAGSFGSKMAAGFIEAASGAKSWASAMEGAAGQAVSALGQYCQVQAMASLAKAIGEWWNGDAAAHDFASAAMWEAAALACGVAGAEISASASGGSGSGAKGGSTGPQGGSIQTTGSGAATGPSQSTNVQRFAVGGLVTGPTLAMLGEVPGTTEGVLPLSDPKAMEHIASKIAEMMPQGGGGDTHHHWNVQGMISPDNLTKVMKQMSRQVRTGVGALHSSNSLRVTKRSA